MKRIAHPGGDPRVVAPGWLGARGGVFVAACGGGAVRGIVRYVEVVARRVGAGLALAAVVGLGIWLSGHVGRASAARIADLAEGRRSVSQASAAVEAARQAEQYDPERFAADAMADARALGLQGFNLEILRAAQAHRRLVSEPVVLSAGESSSLGPLRLRATHEKVRYNRHGAAISARHAVLRVENVGETPLAYLVRVRSADRGQCEVRGARGHNAMALLPGEAAEIVVCAGGGRLRVDALEVLEISTLGYHYLSKVPPLAAGRDAVDSASHGSHVGVPLCEETDAGGIAALVADGLARWVDVADFYSRHDCERFHYFPQYRHATGRRDGLPARPQW